MRAISQSRSRTASAARNHCARRLASSFPPGLRTRASWRMVSASWGITKPTSRNTTASNEASSTPPRYSGRSASTSSTASAIPPSAACRRARSIDADRKSTPTTRRPDRAIGTVIRPDPQPASRTTPDDGSRGSSHSQYRSA